MGFRVNPSPKLDTLHSPLMNDKTEKFCVRKLLCHIFQVPKGPPNRRIPFFCKAPKKVSLMSETPVSSLAGTSNTPR